MLHEDYVEVDLQMTKLLNFCEQILNIGHFNSAFHAEKRLFEKHPNVYTNSKWSKQNINIPL